MQISTNIQKSGLLSRLNSTSGTHVFETHYSNIFHQQASNQNGTTALSLHPNPTPSKANQPISHSWNHDKQTALWWGSRRWWYPTRWVWSSCSEATSSSSSVFLAAENLVPAPQNAKDQPFICTFNMSRNSVKLKRRCQLFKNKVNRSQWKTSQ